MDDERRPSPAVALTLVLGLAGLLAALSEGAFAVSLFLALAALAALPMALADRPGTGPLAFALLGGASAVLALVLVLVPLLGGEQQREQRREDPTRSEQDAPRLPEPARSRSGAPTPPAG